MSTVVKDLGAVSAYAYAVEKGYTGTEAEFAELMADYAEVGQRAEDAADSALNSKTAAQTAATTATNKATEATTAATTATTKAGEASTSASTATSAKDTAVSAASTATTKATEATTAAATAVSAKDDAVSANTAAQSAKTAAQTAQTGAETAAASVQSSAAQIQTNADDISELKEDLSNITGCTQISFVDGKYVNLNGSTADVFNPTAAASYMCAVVACGEGDVFTVSGTAGTSDRVYGFVSSNGTVLNTSAYNEIFDLSTIIAPANAAYLVINSKDKTARSYKGILVGAEFDLVNSAIDETNADVGYLYNDIKTVELSLVGKANQRVKYQVGRYIENGYSTAHKAYINNIGYLSAGTYSFTTTLSANYQYTVFRYVSDSEGTAVQSFGNATTNALKLTGNNKLCVRKLDGVAFTESEIQYVMDNLVIELLSVTQNGETYVVSDDEYEIVRDYSINVQTGNGAVNSNITVNGKKTFHVQNSNGTLVDLRLSLDTALNPVGMSEVMLVTYIPDLSKISVVGVEFIGNATFNRTVSTSTLKTGWNKIRLYTADALQTNWTAINTIRVYATGTAGMELYFGLIGYKRPDKGNIIFIEDGGYSSFYTSGYPALKNLGVMTTWALNPGRLGVGTIITQEQIDAIAADAMSEFSFHSWDASETSQMSAAEIQNDASKCIYYLRAHGLAPAHIWRAAHVQNNAPNASAQVGMVEALATGHSYVGYTVFPFVNPYDVPRRALHDMSNSDIDAMFEKLRKSHCTIVLYTHGIGTGTYEVSAETWEYFISALETALNSGYVRGTSYSRLETERYVTELNK